MVSQNHAIVAEHLLERFGRVFGASEDGLKVCGYWIGQTPTRKHLDRFLAGLEHGLQERRTGRAPSELVEQLERMTTWDDVGNRPLSLAVRLGSVSAQERALSMISDRAVPRADRIALIDAVSASPEPKLVAKLLKQINVEPDMDVLHAILSALRHYTNR